MSDFPIVKSFYCDNLGGNVSCKFAIGYSFSGERGKYDLPVYICPNIDSGTPPCNPCSNDGEGRFVLPPESVSASQLF